MEKHQKEVADYLRDTYRVTNTWIRGGGKHPKLQFIFRGTLHRVPIGNGGDPRVMKNIQAKLKNLLGPPPEPETRPPRTMEDLMSDLNASAATMTAPTEAPAKPASRTWAVTMAAYRQYPDRPGTMVKFIFPPEAITKLPFLMKIEKLDEEHWKLSRGGHNKFNKYGAKLQTGYADKDVEPFGATSAEAIETDGQVLIYLPKDKRKPVNQIGVSVPFKPPVSALERLTPDPAQQSALSALASVTAAPNGAAAMQFASLEDEMRHIRRRVVEIEAMCPYKFIRLETGKLLWRAPTIE